MCKILKNLLKKYFKALDIPRYGVLSFKFFR